MQERVINLLYSKTFPGGQAIFTGAEVTPRADVAPMMGTGSDFESGVNNKEPSRGNGLGKLTTALQGLSVPSAHSTPRGNLSPLANRAANIAFKEA